MIHNFIKLTWLDHRFPAAVEGFQLLARGAVIETDAVTRKAFGSRQVEWNSLHLIILLINFWLISPGFLPQLPLAHQAKLD